MTKEEDTIIRMRAEGFSTTKIGEVLGISRSATCGRMYRMRARGIVLKEVVAKRPDGRSRVEKTHPRPLAPKPPANAAVIGRVSIMDLAPWHCRAVTPEYDSTLYCGALKRDGSSYCDDHHQLYHLPKKPQTPA
jgi:GcrA cell cycle regulator